MDNFIKIHNNEDKDKLDLYNFLKDITYSYKKPKFPYNLLKIEKNLTYKNVYEKYISGTKDKKGGSLEYIFLF